MERSFRRNLVESRGVSKLDGELSNSGLIPLLPPMQRTRDPEGRGAYLRISAESRMTWPSLPQKDNRKWEVSREHGAQKRDNGSASNASRSLVLIVGGFSYSSRENVGGDPVLFLKNVCLSECRPFLSNPAAARIL